MSRKPSRKSRPLYEYIDPLPGAVIATVPQAVDRDQVKRGELIIVQNEYTRKTYGLVAKVLRTPAELAERFPVGCSILIQEFGGIPIYAGGTEGDAWIVSESDILARVDDEYWDEIADTDVAKAG